MCRLNLAPGTTLLLHKDGKSVGPYSIEQIEELLSQGKISPSELAWSEGWPEWKRLDDLIIIAPRESAPEGAERGSIGQVKVFVYKSGQQMGPFTLNEVAGRLAQKTLSEDDSVWASGWPVWAPAACLKRLSATVPPPLPPVLPNMGHEPDVLPYRNLAIVAPLIVVPLVFLWLTWSVGHSLYLWASPLLVLGLLIIASGPTYIKWRRAKQTLPSKMKRVAVVILSIFTLFYTGAFVIALGSALTHPAGVPEQTLVESSEPQSPLESLSAPTPVVASAPPTQPSPLSVGYTLNLFAKREDIDEIGNLAQSIIDSGKYGIIPKQENILDPIKFSNAIHVISLAYQDAFNQYASQARIVRLPPQTRFYVTQSLTSDSVDAKLSDNCLAIKVAEGPYQGLQGFCTGSKNSISDPNDDIEIMMKNNDAEEQKKENKRELLSPQGPPIESNSVSREEWKEALANVSSFYASSGKLMVPTKDFLRKFGNPIKTETKGDNSFWYYQCKNGKILLNMNSNSLAEDLMIGSVTDSDN